MLDGREICEVLFTAVFPRNEKYGDNQMEET